MRDFDDIARLLREHRPELSPMELDEVKQRVRKRADRTPGKGQPMRSRLAILLMLVAGVLVSTTGAGLAVQGATGNGNAAQEQYPGEQPPGEVIGEEETGGGEAGGGENVTPTQPQRQVEVGVQGGGAELPFTGLAAIPIIMLGLGLTITGVLLRRRTGRADG